MDFTSLSGGKTAAGSIMNWTSYTKLDVTTVIDEAQSLLFSMLRCREMRSSWTFAMAVGQSSQPLPPRFLDPVGRIYDTFNNTDYGQDIETQVIKNRSYDTSLSGALPTNAFTTTLNSSSVNVNLTAHGLNQG